MLVKQLHFHPPVTHCGQGSVGGVACGTSEWRLETPKCDSPVSLFLLPQRLHVPDGACARASQTTDVRRLWWVCVYVCVCIWVCKCVFICVCVCICICMCVCVCCHWDLRVTFSSSRAESLLMDTKEKEDLKTESVTWSRSFPGSPLPSVSSSQAAPSDPTLLPLLGLVVSQSPFLSDQQLMQVLSNCTHPWCISCSLYITLCWQSGSVSRICLLAPWPSSLNSSSFLWVSQFIIFDPVFTFHQSCTNEKAACTV